MLKDSDKIESIVSEGRIKLHIFEPSMRKIWTVVGKGDEYWIDPVQKYCSCPSFYFSSINGKNNCYHLQAAIYAQKENKKIDDVIFSDNEFSDFVYGLICNL